MSTFLPELNAEQLAGAKHITSPLCVLAGAGSGKTRLITHRICFLVQERGVNPAQILGVTFTNKAAQEMRSRVNALLPGVGIQVSLGTFHGIAAQLLRIYGTSIGVPHNFIIYDEDDSKKLIKQIALNEFNVDKEDFDPIYRKIATWQNMNADTLAIKMSPDEKDAVALEVHIRYQAVLQSSGAVDFSGLLTKWRDLLDHEHSSKLIYERFQHVVVDEYQDTNSIQEQIVLKLGAAAATLAVVGDDDQSIYGWRGAQPGVMKDFLQKFPSAKLVKLEKNYRSTGTILCAANAIIEKNKTRIGKTLIPVNGSGELVQLKAGYSDREEARDISRLIENSVRAGTGYNEIAILMRTNSLSRSFEEIFQRDNIPYRVVGGMRFYDRKEIKDVLATLRAALNHRSDVDLIRCINAIPRGIGDSSLKKALTAAFERRKTLFEILGDEQIMADYGVTKRARHNAATFIHSLNSLGAEIYAEAREIKVLPADQAVVRAIAISGLGDRFKADESAESEGRLENLDQLLAAAAGFVQDAYESGGDNSVLSFLEGASLMSSADIPSGGGLDNGSVSIMTLHAAKGLEFDLVCMVGMEEGCFPHPRALGYNAPVAELEEERRLAYVGVTRARKQLVLSYASQRMVHGNVQSRQPSRFISDIPAVLIKGMVPGWQHSREKNQVSNSGTAYRPKKTVNGDAVLRREASPQLSSDEKYRAGAQVWHKLYGNGVVVATQLSGSSLRVAVKFNSDPTRRVILSQYLQTYSA